MVDGEESGANGLANIRSFKGSVERAVRNMSECSDERGVLREQIGEKVKKVGLEIGDVLEGRGRRHEKFHGIRGVAEDKASESSRR